MKRLFNKKETKTEIKCIEESKELSCFEKVMDIVNINKSGISERLKGTIENLESYIIDSAERGDMSMNYTYIDNSDKCYNAKMIISHLERQGFKVEYDYDKLNYPAESGNIIDLVITWEDK